MTLSIVNIVTSNETLFEGVDFFFLFSLGVKVSTFYLHVDTPNDDPNLLHEIPCMYGMLISNKTLLIKDHHRQLQAFMRSILVANELLFPCMLSIHGMDYLLNYNNIFGVHILINSCLTFIFFNEIFQKMVEYCDNLFKKI
jgi:hypothetical protein